jgi:hypothetical protein
MPCVFQAPLMSRSAADHQIGLAAADLVAQQLRSPIRRPVPPQTVHPLIQQPPPAGHRVAPHQLLAASHHRNARSHHHPPLGEGALECLDLSGQRWPGAGETEGWSACPVAAPTRWFVKHGANQAL